MIFTTKSYRAKGPVGGHGAPLPSYEIKCPRDAYAQIGIGGNMNSIMVTVSLEGSLWVALFERTDSDGKAVARHICGKEPTDPELYEFIKV